MRRGIHHRVAESAEGGGGKTVGERRWEQNAGKTPALTMVVVAIAERSFGGGGFGGLEAVADPGFGEDVFGLGGVGFDFFAELVDHDAEVFGFFAVVGAPDGL